MTHPRTPAACLGALALAGFFLAPAAGTAQDATGVLAGLWDPGLSGSGGQPLKPARLRTVWIIADPGRGAASKAPPPRNVPHLLIPRSSGFWRAGLAGECRERPILDVNGRPIGTGVTIEEHLWAAPLGVRPTVRVARDGSEGPLEARPCGASTRVYCADTASPLIFWVWPDFASLDLGSASQCGVHPDWGPGYTVRSWSQPDKPLSVDEALGPSAAQAFEAGFKTAYAAAAKDEIQGECRRQAVFQPRSWHVERKAGRWEAEGWSDTHRLCGYGLAFAVATDLSPIMGKSQGGHQRSTAAATIDNNSTGIVDEHSSPGGQWTLAVHPAGLALLRNGRRTAIQAPKLARERLVMVEWVSGAAGVARWDRAVRRLLQEPEPPPRIVIQRRDE